MSIAVFIKNNLRQIENDLLCLRVKYISPESPRRIPAVVQIEATSKCNLRCPECTNSRDSGTGQHLTASELKIILDRLPFPIERVTLSGIGEPLLNPQYFLLVDLLAERHILCRFISNGTLLTGPVCEAIIQRRNIEYVVISCDGGEKKTFENFRLGADFETWKNNIRNFSKKARNERPDLRIGMNTVITKQNLTQLADIVRLAAELGFHNVHFLDPIPVDDIAAKNIPSRDELSAIDFTALYRSGNASGVKVTWAIRRDKLPPRAIPRCLHPWDFVFIRANGNIHPCPANYSQKKLVSMGNIYQNGFEDIWRGGRFREYRRASIKGTSTLCSVCPFY